MRGAMVQVYELSGMHFLPKDWIMERWEEGFYITAMAGSVGGASLVVMSKGTPYTQQSYKVTSLPPVASPHCQLFPAHAADAMPSFNPYVSVGRCHSVVKVE